MSGSVIVQPRPVRRLLLVFSLTLLAGCSSFASPSVSYDPETNFGAYRTYDWTETGALQDLGSESLASVRGAIEDTLGRKGFALNREPDFTVSFTVSQLAYASPGRPAYGSQPSTSFFDAPPDRATESVVTLAITLSDAGTRRALWRGSTSGVLSGADPGAVASQLVPEILAAFPPE